MSFCINAVITKIVTMYLLGPDYTELKRKIENGSQYVKMKGHGVCRIIHTTADSAIIHVMEFSHHFNRIKTVKILYSEWNAVCLGCVVRGTIDYFIADTLWNDGVPIYNLFNHVPPTIDLVI
jgi:hypothetical protein